MTMIRKKKCDCEWSQHQWWNQNESTTMMQQSTTNAPIFSFFVVFINGYFGNTCILCSNLFLFQYTEDCNGFYILGWNRLFGQHENTQQSTTYPSLLFFFLSSAHNDSSAGHRSSSWIFALSSYHYCTSPATASGSRCHCRIISMLEL